MRKRTKVLLWVGCLIAAIALIVLLGQEREPSYQGRSLSYWLHLYVKHSPGISATEVPFADAQRAKAAEAVRHIGTNATPALPVLIRNLQASETTLTHGAAVALGKLALAPDIVVPALTNCLQSPDLLLRNESVTALGKFGSDARSAIPQLRLSLGDTNRYMRETATNALLQIAPEALTNALAQ